MQVTIKDLRNYRALCAEIEQKEQSLREKKQHVFDMVQSSAEFPYSQHNVVIEGDVYAAPTHEERARITQLMTKRFAVEKFVGSITDYKVRRIIELYYIEPAYGEKPTWEDVADRLNDGSTGDACRMVVARYFNIRTK